MSAIPQMRAEAVQKKQMSRYLAPALVRTRKPVVGVGACGDPVVRPGPQAGPDVRPGRSVEARREAVCDEQTLATWAFYRKHTERMLRQYLHASMQVGRSPELLDRSVGRGWVSSRKVKTFEDAVIFVLDMERCLTRMHRADRLLLERVVLQEYTYPEAAELMGLSLRVLARKVPAALDRLTELLVASRLLVLADD